MSMYKWYNPDGDTDKYPKRLVFIQPTTLGDAIEMRAAKAGDEPSQCFDPETELGNLWLTLQASGLNVRSQNLMLFGMQRDASGKGVKVPADIPDPKNPESEFGYAYSAAVLRKFPVPQNLFMLRNKFGKPVLSVSALPYTPEAKASTGGSRKVERAPIALVKAPSALNGAKPPKGIKRVEAAD